jgi:hypothetical protein
MCINNASYPASLEVRKVYAALPDQEAESTGFVRVVDESGEDYLYPRTLFVAIELPPSAAEAVLTAASGGAA